MSEDKQGSYKKKSKENKIKTLKKKKTLWDKYENEFKNINNNCIHETSNNISDYGSDNIECIYNKDNEDVCNICKSNVVITDEGLYTCVNNRCGLINNNIIDYSPEWKYFNETSNSDPTRCGMPINPLLKESSFGCQVLSRGNQSYEMRKIKRYTEWQSMPYKEKSQYDEFQRITIMAQNAGIPKLIIDDAIRYYKIISEEQTFRGLNRDGIIAASIYISCRYNKYPRTSKEIAVIFYLDNTSATKGCKNAMHIINSTESGYNNNEKTDLNQTRANNFIERYCSKLNLNEELTKLCDFIAIRITKENLIPENAPNSIASGIIYFISQVFNLNISKKDINLITGTSEVTTNKCYRKLDDLKDHLIPKKLIIKYNIKL